MFNSFLKTCLTAGAIAVSAISASAQSVDLEFGFAARETRPTTDNDLFLLPIGLTWSRPDGGSRLEFLLAARNEDFSGSYPFVGGVEYTWFQDSDDRRWGLGGRVNYASDITTTAEALAGYQINFAKADIRFTGGLWGSDALVPGRTDTFGAVGVVEASWYPFDSLALRTGLQGDRDGTLVGLGLEWQIGRSDFSVAAESAFALDRYRGQNSYDNLMVTVRWTPGASTPRARGQKLGDRLLHRYAWTQ